MNIYIAVFTIGLSSGHKELIGAYDNYDKAEEAINKHIQKDYYNRDNYSIYEIELNKEDNIVFAEW